MFHFLYPIYFIGQTFFIIATDSNIEFCFGNIVKFGIEEDLQGFAHLISYSHISTRINRSFIRPSLPIDIPKMVDI